ncbi:beta-1,3-galactosyltransferase 4-like [Babylonia areolata]|uniref:beta-1,3-galactosyltransferase 4-like n=1 Tax=Babylonia areolata TaxID=304850 RepID=UPI003FD1CF7C
MALLRFLRKTERQLCLVLLTTSLTVNILLLSPWLTPGPMAFEYPQVDDPHDPAGQPDPVGSTRKVSRHLVPKPGDTAGEGFLQGAGLAAEESPSRELLDPQPRQAETMDGEPPRGAERLAPEQDKPAHEPLSRPHAQPVETMVEEPLDDAKLMEPYRKVTERITKNGTESFTPRELVPKQMPKRTVSNDTAASLAKKGTRVEQVIHSLQVFSDEAPLRKRAPYFTPRRKVQTSFKPEILIDSVRCPPRGPYLLVLIPSVDVNVKARQAIRSTWASPAYGALWPHDARNITSLLKVVFFLGAKNEGQSAGLAQESRTFQDIVQLDFQESYRNLSLKIALAVEWSAAFCPGAGHVMKVDEDTLVNLPLLLDLLRHVPRVGSAGFVLGFHHHQERPPVRRTGKWAVPKQLYSLSRFPRYLFGHSYIMSSGAVRELKAVWRYMPLVPNEDAFLTGILAKVAGITRIHNDWFARKNHNPRKELAHGWSISQTGFKPYWRLYDMWEMVREAYGKGTVAD